MNTEVSNLEKVHKSCKTASKVVNVLHIFIRIAMSICLVASILMFAFHSKLDPVFQSDPEINKKLSVSADFGPVDATNELVEMMAQGKYSYALGTVCLMATIVLIFVSVVLRTIKQMFDVIFKSESPFAETVLRTFRRCSILITVLILLSNGVGYALFLALFFWCIYSIFQYGNELQKENDELL